MTEIHDILKTISQKMEDISKRVEDISKRVEDISKSVDDISQKLDNEVADECKKMGEHIDFVESVYETVKYPLTFVCNRINQITYSSNPGLILEDRR